MPTINTNVTKQCRDCKQNFVTSADEIKWLEEKGLVPFSRCKPCREKNKAKNSLGTWARNRHDELAILNIAGGVSEAEYAARHAHMEDLSYIFSMLP